MDIAHGEIGISLKDQATPELRRVEAEYRAAMARIDRMEANAKLGADLQNLDRKIKEARDKVRRLEGQKADIPLGVDTKVLDERIDEAKRKVKSLDGQRATIQIKTRGAEVALAQIEAVNRAEAARAAAEERYARAHQQHSTKAALDTAREREEIAKLQQEWAKMSDQMEKLKTRRTPFGKEARIKVELETEHLDAKMEMVKARLNALGSHPPVGIETDVDAGALKRMRYKIGRVLAGAGDKIANVGNLRIMGNSLRTVAAVVATLGPMIVSLGGAATALVGVLGTGLTGAAAVAGGTLAGLGMNLIGVKAALSPVAKDFKINTQLVDAYHKAVLKFGKGSDEATKAQDQMNHALKTMNPLARQAAKAAGGVSTSWQKLTSATANRDFSKLMIGGVKTLNTLMPTLAHNTNQSMNIITKWGTGVERALRTPAAVHIFDSLGHSANQFLGPALNGLSHLGAAFGHVAESAARIFAGPSGRGFEKWAADLDKATQPGAKLDGTITRLGHHAGDLLHFFGALGRLLVTVFNGGADSGDRMVNSMTNALNRWNAFLRTGQGQDKMSTFFRRSEADARALWSTLGPLVGAFVQWSNLLAPFATGILKGVSYVSKLVAGFVKLTGMAGPLTALGGTLGAMFALSKIGAFVGMLSRVVSLFKEAYVAARTLGATQAGLTLRQGMMPALRPNKYGAAAAGGAGGEAAAIRAAHAEGGASVAAQIRGALAEGGAVAANEERAGVAEGGAVAAGELRGAMATGGAVAGAEGALGGMGGVGGAAATAERAGGRFRRAAGAALDFGSALTGIPAPALAVVAVGAAMIEGLHLLDKAFNSAKEAENQHMEALDRTVTRGEQGVARSNTRYMQARDVLGQYGSALAHSNSAVRDARQQLAGTTKGTQAYKDALLNLHDAERQRIEDRKQFFDTRGEEQRAAEDQVKNANAAVDANKRLVDSLRKRYAEAKGSPWAKVIKAELDAVQARTNGLAEQQQSAWNRMAALPAQAARGIKGFAALTGEAEQQVGRLARTAGGKSLAVKISTKFDDPKKAGQVAQQTRNALQAGVGKATVARIVADTSNADQAIRRLRAVRIEAKRVAFRSDEGDVLNAVAKLRGIKLPPKIQRLLHEGDPAVIAAVRKIIGQSVPPKVQHILQVGAQGVSSWLSRLAGFNIGEAVKRIYSVGGESVLSQLNQILAMHDLGSAFKSITVTTHHKGATGGAFASGGVNQPELIARQQRAASVAQARGPAVQRHGRFNRPTLLVGEEDRTEYVIATNPAYRDRNREYLKMAASDLGMTVVEAAARGRGHHVRGMPTPGRARRSPLSTSHRVGPVDYSDLTHDVARADNAIQDATGQISNLNSRIHSRQGSRPRSAAGKRAKTHDLHQLRARLKKMEANLKWLRRVRKQRQKLVDKAQTAHQHFENEDTNISTLEARMESANLDGNTKLYNRLRGQRSAAIQKEIKELQSALKALPRRKRGGTWGTGLKNAIATRTRDLKENTRTKSDAEQTTADNRSTFGDPKDAKRLAALQEQVALAALRTDDPRTPNVDEGLQARTGAATNLRNFWRNVLARLQVQHAGPSRITNAATELRGAQDALDQVLGTDTSGGASSLTGQQQIYSTARADLLSSFGSNIAPLPTWASPVSPAALSSPSAFGGAAQQGGVASGGATQQVSVVNNFPTPPPDPHTWSAGLSWELQAGL